MISSPQNKYLSCVLNTFQCQVSEPYIFKTQLSKVCFKIDESKMYFEKKIKRISLVQN